MKSNRYQNVSSWLSSMPLLGAETVIILQQRRDLIVLIPVLIRDHLCTDGGGFNTCYFNVILSLFLLVCRAISRENRNICGQKLCN